MGFSVFVEAINLKAGARRRAPVALHKAYVKTQERTTY